MIENKYIEAGFNAQQLFEYLSQFTPEERKAREIFIRSAPENSDVPNIKSIDYIENSTYGFFGQDIPCLIFNDSGFAPKEEHDIGIYEIWREGFCIQGESGPAELLGIESGKNFREAVLKWYHEQNNNDRIRVLRFIIKEGAIAKIYDNKGNFLKENIAGLGHSYRSSEFEPQFNSQVFVFGTGRSNREVVDIMDVEISESNIAYSNVYDVPMFYDYIYANYEVKKYRRKSKPNNL